MTANSTILVFSSPLWALLIVTLLMLSVGLLMAIRPLCRCLQLKNLQPLHLCLLALLLLFNLNGCGAGDILSPTSSTTATATTTADQSDNSVNGVTQCSCEPIDIANCNDSTTEEATQPPVCYLSSCTTPAGVDDGPNISSVKPENCVEVQSAEATA